MTPDCLTAAICQITAQPSFCFARMQVRPVLSSVNSQLISLWIPDKAWKLEDSFL